MKTRSKERMAALLLEELFAELGENEEVRQMLGELASLPIDEVIAQLSADFRESLARRSSEAAGIIREREQAAVTPVVPVVPTPEPVVPPEPVSAPEDTSIPPAPSPPAIPATPRVEPVLPASELRATPPAPNGEARVPPPAEVVPPAPKEKPPSPPAPLPEVPPRPEAKRPASPLPPETAGDEVPPLSDKYWGALEDSIRRSEEAVSAGEEGGGEDFRGTLSQADAGELHMPVEFADDDVVYVHAAALIPQRESPADHPFMLEEKGIDGRTFAFAFDYSGMRFYLSKVQLSTMNVSKTGVLLLGKQESMHVRGVHEAALNDFRLHGIVLPFAFGTIARGKDDLMTKVDAHQEPIRAALDAIQATRWWVVRVYVLDARIAQLVAKEEVPVTRKGRTVERASYTKVPVQKKFDIKVLERILSKEKRLADSVHEELKDVAERSDIDMIVGLGSGSSEDWKIILEASYEVRSGHLGKFFHAVADLQYRHLTFDVMLTVSGDSEPYSFRPA